MVWPNDSVAGNLDSAQRALVVLASVVLAVTLTWRWIVASPPLRRALVPILVGSVGILLGSVLVALDKFRIEFPTARWAVVVAYVAVPLVVLGGILRSRLARSTVGDLFVEIQADPTPGELRDALAKTLRDPSLTLAYWLPQFRSWSDLDGRPVRLPVDGGDSSATMIDRNGEHMAALIHDHALVDEPELLEAVSAAAGIAIENGRLHVELRARLEELRGSRSRIVEAGQKERQRLERNLHDGAQQRLIALSLELSLLEQELGADGGARPAPGAGAARDRDLARRAARGRARPPPRRRQRPRARGRARAARGARARARSSDGRGRRAPPGADRGRRLLPRLREPRERRKARARLGRHSRRQPDRRRGRRRDRRRRRRRRRLRARHGVARSRRSRRSARRPAAGLEPARAAAHASGRRSRARRDRRGQRPPARRADAASGRRTGSRSLAAARPPTTCS